MLKAEVCFFFFFLELTWLREPDKSEASRQGKVGGEMRVPRRHRWIWSKVREVKVGQAR